MRSGDNTKVQHNSNELNPETAPGQGVQPAASIDNNSASATPVVKKDASIQEQPSTGDNSASATPVVKKDASIQEQPSTGDNSASVTPVVKKDTSTKTEEVKGDVSSQAAAKKDHPSRLTTDVDALFKALEDNKVIFRDSESKERLKKAFKEAKDYNSLIEKAGSKQVEICINACGYEGVKQHISESLIKSCEESVTKAVEIADKYFGGGRSAYYTKSKDNKLNILNVFLTSNVNEPTKISDLLEKEKGIDKLRVYRLGKKEVVASRSKKDDIDIRNYNFKEGANYEMTITWAVETTSGISILTMVVGVDKSGITKFYSCAQDGEPVNNPNIKNLLYLTEQNQELCINGKSLHETFKLFVMGRNSETLVQKPVTNGTVQGVQPTNNVQSNAATQPVDSTQSSVAPQTVDSAQTTQPVDSTQSSVAPQTVDSAQTTQQSANNTQTGGAKTTAIKSDNSTQTSDASKDASWVEKEANRKTAKGNTIGVVV
ncbi:Hypothetical protein CINCED_3A017424 [Cinara cedri]|uniref:Uncharacterized protein n=1 Tax=Cinara cedri TaxID=506608 RepID=A0A5E4MDQ1_9HEMI|nr:Hypothetical protein CINCED_3A017424 [Cinara cedri]